MKNYLNQIIIFHLNLSTEYKLQKMEWRLGKKLKGHLAKEVDFENVIKSEI